MLASFLPAAGSQTACTAAGPAGRLPPKPQALTTKCTAAVHASTFVQPLPRKYTPPATCPHALPSSTEARPVASRVPDVADGVVIVGAGLAGLCAAAALNKVGIPSVVLEQRGELSREGAAIALWTNGLRALDAIGVGATVRREFEGLQTVRICRNDGRVLRQFDFTECAGGPHELLGVKRARLQRILYEALPEGQVIMDATVAEVLGSRGNARPVVRLEGGEELPCRLVVGADGVRSVVASSVGVPPANFSGQAGFRGLAQFPSADAVPVQPRTVSQIWGEGNRAGVYPMAGNEVYWFVTFDAAEALPQLSQAEMKARALELVDGWGLGVAECVRATPEGALSCNRFLDRWPSPFGALCDGPATLVGDAFHPVTPDLGQGGCMALEDGIILARALKDAWGADDESALTQALRRYEADRAKRCLPVAVRSRGMGAILQSGLPPVVAARDTVVSRLLDISHFFDHTLFDCGTLP